MAASNERAARSLVASKNPSPPPRPCPALMNSPRITWGDMLRVLDMKGVRPMIQRMFVQNTPSPMEDEPADAVLEMMANESSIPEAAPQMRYAMKNYSDAMTAWEARPHLEMMPETIAIIDADMRAGMTDHDLVSAAERNFDGFQKLMLNKIGGRYLKQVNFASKGAVIKRYGEGG